MSTSFFSSPVTQPFQFSNMDDQDLKLLRLLYFTIPGIFAVLVCPPIQFVDLDVHAGDRCAEQKGNSTGWCIRQMYVQTVRHERTEDVCGLTFRLPSPIKGEVYNVIRSTYGDESVDCGLIVSGWAFEEGFYWWALLSPLDERVLDYVSDLVVEQVSIEDVRLVTYRMKETPPPPVAEDIGIRARVFFETIRFILVYLFFLAVQTVFVVACLETICKHRVYKN